METFKYEHFHASQVASLCLILWFATPPDFSIFKFPFVFPRKAGNQDNAKSWEQERREMKKNKIPRSPRSRRKQKRFLCSELGAFW